MYVAFAMMLAFVVLAACVRELGAGRRAFGTVGLGLALPTVAALRWS